MKSLRFCEGGSPDDYLVLEKHPSLAQKTDRCPRAQITDEIGEILWLWRQWKDGKPPVPGGPWDQPAGLIECFRLIDRVEYAVQLDEIEREKRKNG